jgi:Holliday junction DNA helicase RuvA
MIGRLRGIVAEIGEEEALIDVMGVGYIVRCGSRTLQRLPPVGDETTVQVEPQWADQTGLRLYGFLSHEERRAFVALQEIQGVGPKAALAVLDVLAPAELMAAAHHGDKAVVARASGVGPKLALRIVTELKAKPIATDNVVVFHAAAAAAPPTSAAGEAIAALMSLGVAEPVARRAVEHAAARLGGDAPESALIKGALQELGRERA